MMDTHKRIEKVKLKVEDFIKKDAKKWLSLAMKTNLVRK